MISRTIRVRYICYIRNIYILAGISNKDKIMVTTILTTKIWKVTSHTLIILQSCFTWFVKESRLMALSITIERTLYCNGGTRELDLRSERLAEVALRQLCIISTGNFRQSQLGASLIKSNQPRSRRVLSELFYVFTTPDIHAWLRTYSTKIEAFHSIKTAVFRLFHSMKVSWFALWPGWRCI